MTSTVRCPHCRSTFAADPGPGGEVACSTCGKRLKVPATKKPGAAVAEAVGAGEKPPAKNAAPPARSAAPPVKATAGAADSTAAPPRRESSAAGAPPRKTPSPSAPPSKRPAEQAAPAPSTPAPPRRTPTPPVDDFLPPGAEAAARPPKEPSTPPATSEAPPRKKAAPPKRDVPPAFSAPAKPAEQKPAEQKAAKTKVADAGRDELLPPGAAAPGKAVEAPPEKKLAPKVSSGESNAAPPARATKPATKGSSLDDLLPPGAEDLLPPGAAAPAPAAKAKENLPAGPPKEGTGAAAAAAGVADAPVEQRAEKPGNEKKPAALPDEDLLPPGASTAPKPVDRQVEDLLPPGAEVPSKVASSPATPHGGPAVEVELPPGAEATPAKAPVDLPPGAREAGADGEESSTGTELEQKALPQDVESLERAPEEEERFEILAPDGSRIELVKPRRYVGEGENRVALRELTPEQRERRRALANTIAFGVCTFLLVLFIGVVLAWVQG